MHIILASASPRRKELLSYLGIAFEVIVPAIDEAVINGEPPADFCARVCRDKALAVGSDKPDALIIAADTIVVIDGRILGKPQDKDQAVEFLKLLRSRAHEVYTGYTVAVIGADRIVTRVVRTTVHFRAMSDEEIRWYISTCEPMDKAGAYALQGLGAIFVDRIDGSYTNVIGLPLAELYHDLKTFAPPLKIL